MKYSIIITSYNSAKYIKRCLDSIINQTVQNFKILVIDDGSTDNTKDIIATYQKKHKNIEYYYKKNGGVSDARNYGASKVETPYFLYVDSDDYVPIDLIETVDKYSDYDILSFKGIKVDEKGKFIESLEKESFNLLDGRSYLKSLMNNNSFFLVPWGYVYKTKFWQENKFEYSKDYVLEDTSLTPIVIMNAEELISIDYYGYYYVQTNESITRTKSDEKIKFNTKCALYHYDCLINYVESHNYSESFNTLFFHFFAHYLIWYGATLPDNHLNKYCKELRKRNVYDRLRNQYLSDKKERAICNFSYRLYIFRSKHLKWKIESIYYKHKRRFNNVLSLIIKLFNFIYWKIIHKLFCVIKDFFVSFYWNVIHNIYIFMFNKLKWIYYNIIKKIYWRVRTFCSFVYWKIIRKIYFDIIKRFFTTLYWKTSSLLVNIYWFIRNKFVKAYWLIHKIVNKFYWGIKSFFSKIYWTIKSNVQKIINKIYWGIKSFISKIYWTIKSNIQMLINKIYWGIKSFISKIYWTIKSNIQMLINKIYWKTRSFFTTNSIKIYWKIINLWNFIFWKIIHKMYWKFRGVASLILRKTKNLIRRIFK